MTPPYRCARAQASRDALALLLAAGMGLYVALPMPVASADGYGSDGASDQNATIAPRNPSSSAAPRQPRGGVKRAPSDRRAPAATPPRNAPAPASSRSPSADVLDASSVDASTADGSGASTQGAALESVGFYRRPDAELDFLSRRAAWQTREKTAASWAVQDVLAKAADEAATIDAPFSAWRAQGGPHPWRFRARAHVRNPGDRAWLDVRVEFRWSAEVGDLLADPDLLLTDYDYLASSARWRALRVESAVLPALAPGEDALIDSQPFSIFEFLQRYPNQWPRQLRVEARLTHPATGARQRVQMELIPDHFIAPDAVGRRMAQ